MKKCGKERRNRYENRFRYDVISGDGQHLSYEETFYKTIEEACQGGVTLVQLREKNCGGREYLEKAMKVKAITDRYQIPLIIDDRVDVAIAW